MSKVRCGHILTKIMRNISIPVNGSTLRGCKRDLLEKLDGGCTSYDITAP